MEYTKEIINAYKIISDVLKEIKYNLGINSSTILKWSLDE